MVRDIILVASGLLGGVVISMVYEYMSRLRAAMRQKQFMNMIKEKIDFGEIIKAIESRGDHRAKEFYDSPEFEPLYEKILSKVKQYGTIDSDKIARNEQIVDLTYEEVGKFSDAVTTVVQDHTTEPNNQLQHQIKTYKELNLYWSRTPTSTYVQIYETSKPRC